MDTAAKTLSICDAHVHLQDARFGKTYEEVGAYVERARAAGVASMVCAGTSPADWNRTAELCKRFDGLYAAFGVHPWQVGKIKGEWVSILADLLAKYTCKDGKTRAMLGEVGLDFAVREMCPELQQAQESVLTAQLNLANSLKLPVALHSVRANDRVLKIVKNYPKVPCWLLHGWTASKSEIDQAVELGAFFSFSSRSTSADASRARATVAQVPRDRILLESDGPRLTTPSGYAGKPTGTPEIFLQRRSSDGYILEEPAAVVAAAKEIAAIRKTSEEDFFAQLSLNEKRFFRTFAQKAD